MHSRLQKHIFEYKPNCSEKIFVIKESKYTAPGTYVIKYLNSDDINGVLFEK